MPDNTTIGRRWPTASLSDRLFKTGRTFSGIPPNERILYLEVAFQSVLAAGSLAYLSVFLTRLGASTWLITAFSSLPALVNIIFAIPVGIYVQKQTNLVSTANWGRFIYRLTTGLYAFLPLFSPQAAAVILVSSYAMIALPSLVSNVAVTTILGRATSAERRPLMLSVRLAVNGLVASIVGFLSGRWLNGTPYPFNYQVLFISGFVAGLISIYIFSKLHIKSDNPQTAKGSYSLRALFNTIKEAPQFRRWSWVTFLFRTAIAAPQALYVVYKVRVMGASDAWIGVLILVENGLSVLIYLLLGRFCNRPVFKKYLWVTLLGTALYPITTALAHTPEMLVVPAICSAVFSATMNIFISNTLYKVLPQGQQATCIAADTLLANGAAFIGPMLGTLLSDSLGIVNAFYIIAVFRGVTALFFRVFRVGTD